MTLNKLMWDNIHYSAVSTIIEPTCSNLVHSNQGSIYLFEVNNGNIETTCEICLKLTINTLNIFQTCFNASIPDPEQLNTSWVLGATLQIKLKLFVIY